MSYQVLARKWRPKSFATLVGQDHVVQALTHALTVKRLHHAYLFTGTRGVGKTTLARILAKSLNCETGITASPCGECTACREIDAGRFVDLLEVDAATNTRVDEMRQLLENAVYAPTRGRFKVYVIDEVHMLSTSAFNAMLKTLEEPPEHVKFVLATTDPQKIPVTVLSRCLQFNLKQMNVQAITLHLAHILQAEGIEHDVAALNALAKCASGSMRDALSLLDQAIAHGSGRVLDSQVRAMLGTVDGLHVQEILEAILLGDGKQLMRVAAQLAMRHVGFDHVLQELALLVTELQVRRLVPEYEEASGAALSLDAMALLDAELLQLFYQIILHGRQDLPFAPDEYSGFLMTLLRLFAFRPENVQEILRYSKLPEKEVVRSNTAVSPVVQISDEAPPSNPKYVRADRDAAPVSWSAVLAELPLSGLVKTLAQSCELKELSDNRCVLHLSPAMAHLQTRTSIERLEKVLSDYFQRSISVCVELIAPKTETPIAQISREKAERQADAVAAIAHDPFVRQTVELFEASVLEASIQPTTY